MQPAPEDIGLSHSLDGFCAMQNHYVKVRGLRKPENFIFTRGKVSETMVATHLQNLITGNNLDIEVSGQTRMGELCQEMVIEESKQLISHFPLIAEGARRYIAQSINYEPVEIGKWFKLDVKGFTRIIRGQLDVVGDRDGMPVIIDLKYQMKPIPLNRFYKQKVEWVRQLVLYSIFAMKEYNLEIPPPCEVHVVVAGSDPQVFPIDVTEALMYDVLNRQHNLNIRLDAGYWPMNREHNLCSPQWCHVYALCHEENTLGQDELLDLVEILQ